MTRKRKALLISIGALSFLVHLFFTAAAWALHPGNMAHRDPNASTLLWDVLSLPFLPLAPSSFVNTYFFVSLGINSALWAGACVLLVRVLLNRIIPKTAAASPAHS